MKLKFLFLILAVLVWSAPSVAYAQTQQEEIKLTTYYPAPYGDYDKLSVKKVTDTQILQLAPVTSSDSTGDGTFMGEVNAFPSADKEGMIILDNKSGTHVIKHWDSGTNDWIPFGGSPAHNVVQCVVQGGSDFPTVTVGSEYFLGNVNVSVVTYDNTKPITIIDITPTSSSSTIIVDIAIYHSYVYGNGLAFGLFKTQDSSRTIAARFSSPEGYGGRYNRFAMKADSVHPITFELQAGITTRTGNSPGALTINDTNALYGESLSSITVTEITL